MSREDLLLTAKAVCDKCKMSEKSKKTCDAVPCQYVAGYRDGCEAQLDKALKPEWKDKPDSEGWWWFTRDGCEGTFVHIWQTVGVTPLMADDRQLKDFLKEFKGNWQRALVPEGE